ncbi:MAG: arginine--tRNA ligase [Alphaproteobacteria bacterium]|nr:arginine--tRNA ligase [Alphaproteobacteria bacterium]
MNTIIEELSKLFCEAFTKAGYKADLGRVVISARPDLCQYQVNGAMGGAKLYHKAPMMIAQDVVAAIPENEIIKNVAVVNPGFINISVKDSYIADYMQQMLMGTDCGFKKTAQPQKVVLDYGGPNVAKTLHVGHLRSAVIGDALKRINRFYGNQVIADAHLGDYGLQMGLIIHELFLRQPELPYFDENYQGEYPKQAPFTLKDLGEIYPTASAKSKEDEQYLAAARLATVQLQQGRRGYYALWQHIMNISLPDLRHNYARLEVDFDYWLRESDAKSYIPAMVEKMKQDGHAYISEGALVVDVKEESDTQPIPPCIILKSDGSAIYETTDLATLVQREQDFAPDRVIYVVDKRQFLHFERVFRCAKKTGIVRPNTELSFIGFGTVNGKDGKPFKTRSGGTMKLADMIDMVQAAVHIKDEENLSQAEVQQLKQTIGLAAIKYGDLMNPTESSYIFDLDKFTSFEGNTGPYILYTMVRIKSILAKLNQTGKAVTSPRFAAFSCDSERDLALALVRFSHTVSEAAKKDAPSIICSYIYEVANKFNIFYHDKKILAETDTTALSSLVALISLTLNILNICTNLLGFKAPEKM